MALGKRKDISTTLSSTSSTPSGGAFIPEDYVRVDYIRIDFVMFWTTSTAAYHARGLAIAYSRKLSAMLGGSTSTRPGVRKITIKTCDFINISNATIPTTLGGSISTCPGVRKITIKTCDFIDISNATIPIALGGSTTTSPPIVAMIL
jgi:hypothetical protein